MIHSSDLELELVAPCVDDYTSSFIFLLSCQRIWGRMFNHRMKWNHYRCTFSHTNHEGYTTQSNGIRFLFLNLRLEQLQLEPSLHELQDYFPIHFTCWSSFPYVISFQVKEQEPVCRREWRNKRRECRLTSHQENEQAKVVLSYTTPLLYRRDELAGGGREEKEWGWIGNTSSWDFRQLSTSDRTRRRIS